MLAAVLSVLLLASVHCLPSPQIPDAIQPDQELTPELAKTSEPEKSPALPSELTSEIPLQDAPVDVGGVPVVPGGAPGPVDLAGSPDAHPGVNVGPAGKSDLDADATFWGYGGWGGGYKPYYYGYRSYQPWGYSNYGGWGGGYGGRGYGGWGGWGFGGRGWGWGNRGGWDGNYWG